MKKKIEKLNWNQNKNENFEKNENWNFEEKKKLRLSTYGDKLRRNDL